MRRPFGRWFIRRHATEDGTEVLHDLTPSEWEVEDLDAVWFFDPAVKVRPKDRVSLRWCFGAPPMVVVTERGRWYRPWRRTRMYAAKPRHEVVGGAPRGS